jgi:hypothetical protein
LYSTKIVYNIRWAANVAGDVVRVGSDVDRSPVTGVIGVGADVGAGVGTGASELNVAGAPFMPLASTLMAVDSGTSTVFEAGTQSHVQLPWYALTVSDITIKPEGT